MDTKGNFPKREERVPYGRAIPNEPPTKTKQKSKKKLSPYRQKYNAQHNIKPVKRKKYRRIPAKNRRLLTLIIGILAVVLLLLVLFRQNGREIFIGETSMGIIKDKSVTVESLTDLLTTQLTQEVGTNVKINETLEIKPVHISKSRQKDVWRMDSLTPQLRQKVTYLVEAAAITLDGKDIIIVANQATADEVFQEVQAEYIPEGEDRQVETSFVENVKVEMKYVDPSVIVAKENAVQELKKGTRVEKKYIVQSGDALYKIASQFGMTQEELKALNPNISTKGNVYVGQELTVMADQPMLSVKTVETIVLTEVQEKQTVYQQDSTKNKGYQKVTETGKDGQKEVTKKLTYINNELTNEEITNEKITLEPIDEVIVQGTK